MAYRWRRPGSRVGGDPVFEDRADPTPSYIMWLEWRDGQISFIRDYRYVRYVTADAELTLEAEPRRRQSVMRRTFLPDSGRWLRLNQPVHPQRGRNCDSSGIAGVRLEDEFAV
jgi:hypothetical protein